MLVDLSMLNYKVDGKHIQGVEFPDHFPCFTFFIFPFGSTVYFKKEDVFYGLSFLDFSLKDFVDYLSFETDYIFKYNDFFSNLSKVFNSGGYYLGRSSDFFKSHFLTYLSSLFTLTLSILYDKGIVPDYLYDYFYFSVFACNEKDCIFIDYDPILDFSGYYLESISYDGIILRFDGDLSFVPVVDENDLYIF